MMEQFRLKYLQKRWQKVLLALGAIAVFITTYALILPAITLDTDKAESDPAIGYEEYENLPAQTLTERIGDVEVRVEADEGVFPEDTQLVLSEKSADDLMDTLITAVQADVLNAECVDISFVDANGSPVEPQNAYRVDIESDALAAQDDKAVVLVSGDSAEVVERPVFTYRACGFETDTAGSTIAMLVTKELAAEVISADGAVYSVNVTYDATALIPDGASLSLTELSQDSAAYGSAKQLLIDSDLAPESGDDDPGTGGAALSLSVSDDETDPWFGGLDVFDLSILDANGNEIEPASPVTVEITMKSLPTDVSEDDFYTSAAVTHLKQTGAGIVPELVAGNLSGQPGEIDVKDGGAVMTFETDSFSTYTISWGRTGTSRATVHYGYMNNGTFTEFDQSVFSNGVPSISRSNVPNYLIYDVAGYDFDYAYRNNTGTRIQPMLNSTGTTNYRTYAEGTGLSSSPETISLSSGDNIYMVYKKTEDPVPSGVPKVYETSETPHEPEIMKESVNNHDGTRTLSLSITGYEAPLEYERFVDVIVIFDISGSMNTELQGSSNSRLEAGIDSLKFLSNMLLGEDKVNREGEKLNRMALIEFSNSAEIVQDFTDDPAVYNAAVDGLTAIGGTNWELPLKIANRMSVDKDRKTVVIFVSDGNPTWRMTRYNVSDAQLRSQNDMHTGSTTGYYRLYDVFGQGNSDDRGRNYDAALAEAQSIVGQGKEFYTIAIGPDVNKMEQLTEESGSGPDNAFTVQTEQDLTDAINRIKDSINGSYGWGDVEMNDGITGLTNLLAKTPITGLDESSFTYTRIDKNGVESAWDPVAAGADVAVYNPETEAVEWHMGPNFQLEDQVTYKVSFKVWPNQEASNIVTELNNGTITYDSLSDEIKAQIQNSGGVYTVKTNSDDAHVTYCPSYSTNGTVTITGDPEIQYFPPVDPLVVQTMPLTVEKKFFDSFGDETGDGVGADRPDEVHLTLERRPLGSTEDWERCEVTYEDPNGDTVTTWDIWLSDGNDWKATFFVSPGLWDAGGVHRNVGYEYRLTEEETEYHYELFSEELNPYLQGYEEPTDDMDPALAQQDVYVVRNYNGDTDNSETLTARNVVKGGINLMKHVVSAGSGADPNAEFTIRGRILDPNGNPYLFDPANDDRPDQSQRPTSDTPLFLQHQNDPLVYHFYNSEGRRVIYKGHFASTGEIEFKIKDGEQIRFPIIPSGSTYLFWEVDGDGMPTGFVLDSITGVAQEKLPDPATGEYVFVDSPDLSKYPVVNDQDEVGGTIYGNTLYKLDFNNRHLEPDRITVTKTVVRADGVTPIWPTRGFTIRGYITNRFGLGYTFDPALDDREDKSQPLPESEYATHTWDDHQDDPIAYNIVDKDGNFVIYKGHFPTTDSFEVTLRAGETLEFLDVPALSSYMIWEDTTDLHDPNGYEYVSTTVSASSQTGTVTTQPRIQQSFGEDCAAGTVHEGEEHDVLITNKLNLSPVSLRLVKVDAEDHTKKLNGATFRLFFDSDLEIPATDFYGNEIGPIVTNGFDDAAQTVPSGLAYIADLAPGTYYLSEKEAPHGYNGMVGAVTVTIDAQGNVTVLQADHAANDATVSVQDGVVTIMITNSTGGELPQTGGRGTTLFYISGGALLAAAAGIYILESRRRKRGMHRPDLS